MYVKFEDVICKDCEYCEMRIGKKKRITHCCMNTYAKGKRITDHIRGEERCYQVTKYTPDFPYWCPKEGMQDIRKTLKERYESETHKRVTEERANELLARLAKDGTEREWTMEVGGEKWVLRCGRE